jgi:hypothetical protein
LADCGNLKFPDLNCTDFGKKTRGFGLVLLGICPEKFFDPNLRGGSPEKLVLRKKPPTFLGKIWKKYG